MVENACQVILEKVPDLPTAVSVVKVALDVAKSNNLEPAILAKGEVGLVKLEV